MHRVKDTNLPWEVDDVERREPGEENQAEEDRDRVIGALQNPAQEIGDTTAVASMASTCKISVQGVARILQRIRKLAILKTRSSPLVNFKAIFVNQGREPIHFPWVGKSPIHNASVIQTNDL